MSDEVTGPRPPGSTPARAGARRDAAPPPPVLVIEVEGELDLTTVPDLCARLAPTHLQQRSRVLLDLSGVAFCDASGLTPLLRAAHEIVVHGGQIAIVVPPGSPPARLFLVTGMVEFLTTVPDRKAGLELLGSGAQT
jgi:anti-sigma B factor antagonist